MQDAESTTTNQPKQYQCRHIFTDGHRCASPCLRREEFCYYHHTTRRPVANPHQRRSRSSTFHLPLPEDRSAIQSSIGQVLQRITANEIDPRRAGLLLYGLQIASLNLPKIQPAKTAESQTVEEITIDPTLGVLAPRTEVSEIAKRKSPVAQLIERMMQSEEKPAPTPEPATIPTLQATADNRPSQNQKEASSHRKEASTHQRRSHPSKGGVNPSKGGVIPTGAKRSGGIPALSFCSCLSSSKQPRASSHPTTSFDRSAAQRRNPLLISSLSQPHPPLPLPVPFQTTTSLHSPKRRHFDRSESYQPRECHFDRSEAQRRNPLLYLSSLPTASSHFPTARLALHS